MRIDILRYGLSPDEALTGRGGRPRRPRAARPTRLGEPAPSAVEVSSLLAKRAKIKRAHQVVLLRVGAAGADTSYDRVRHGWRIGRRWTDPDSPRSPRWAAIVAGDLVAAVYRIDRWEPARAPRLRPVSRRRAEPVRPPSGSPSSGTRSRARAIATRAGASAAYLGRGIAEPGDLRVVRAPLGQHATAIGPGPTVRAGRGPPAPVR